MARKKLNTLEDIGEASQLVNDFKVSKKSYFDLKHQQLELIGDDSESVDDDYWEDENFEAEIKIFDERRKLYDEAQELYKALKSKLEHGTPLKQMGD
jgi:phage-related protein